MSIVSERPREGQVPLHREMQEREAQMLSSLAVNQYGATLAEQRELDAAHQKKIDDLWAAHAEADEVNRLQKLIGAEFTEVPEAVLSRIASGKASGSSATVRTVSWVRNLLALRPVMGAEWVSDTARLVLQRRQAATLKGERVTM